MSTDDTTRADAPQQAVERPTCAVEVEYGWATPFERDRQPCGALIVGTKCEAGHEQ